MTCREKLALEHPEKVGPQFSGGCCGCPSGPGYLEDPPQEWCKSVHCAECWDREIPETEEKAEKHMTCREKLAVDNPKLTKEALAVITNNECPKECGYLDDPDFCAPFTEACERCWDREIPGTNTDISNNEKENEIMPTDSINRTKMTKRELIEEIKIAHNHIVEMERKLEDLQKYEKYKDCADEIKAIHTALMDSGFTNEQAFDLLKTTMQSMMPTIPRGVRL